jgi:RNA-directed DNA polymerase
MMNPKLRGWANYYRHCAAKKVFGYVGQWQFHSWQKIANMDCLFNIVQIAHTPIERHGKERINTWFNPVLAAL